MANPTPILFLTGYRNNDLKIKDFLFVKYWRFLLTENIFS